MAVDTEMGQGMICDGLTKILGTSGHLGARVTSYWFNKYKKNICGCNKCNIDMCDLFSSMYQQVSTGQEGTCGFV